VGRVSAFAIAGLDLWFNTNDHRPPHFHAEKPGEWEVRVRFLRDRSEMFETVWTRKRGAPSSSDLKDLAKATEDHRGALLAEWETKVPVKTPGPER
jgi:hypothetical protein